MFLSLMHREERYRVTELVAAKVVMVMLRSHNSITNLTASSNPIPRTDVRLTPPTDVWVWWLKTATSSWLEHAGHLNLLLLPVRVQLAHHLGRDVAGEGAAQVKDFHPVPVDGDVFASFYPISKYNITSWGGNSCKAWIWVSTKRQEAGKLALCSQNFDRTHLSQEKAPKLPKNYHFCLLQLELNTWSPS